MLEYEATTALLEALREQRRPVPNTEFRFSKHDSRLLRTPSQCESADGSSSSNSCS